MLSWKPGHAIGLENRSDLRISTLAKAIGSLGGELRLQAVFPDGRARELVLNGHRLELTRPAG